MIITFKVQNDFHQRQHWHLWEVTAHVWAKQILEEILSKIVVSLWWLVSNRWLIEKHWPFTNTSHNSRDAREKKSNLVWEGTDVFLIMCLSLHPVVWECVLASTVLKCRYFATWAHGYYMNWMTHQFKSSPCWITLNIVCESAQTSHMFHCLVLCCHH